MPEKRKSAFIKATQEAQQAPSIILATTSTNTATPLEGDIVTEQAIPNIQRETNTSPKKDKKVTFYLTQEQDDKLDTLEMEFRQRHKRKINRNDIIRYLIDQCDVDNLREL